MNANLIKLAERKTLLVARIGNQRTELEQALAPWHGRLAIVDKGLLAVQYLKCHPVLLAGLILFPLIFRPKLAIKWFQRGWLVWKMALTIRRKLSGL